MEKKMSPEEKAKYRVSRMKLFIQQFKWETKNDDTDAIMSFRVGYNEAPAVDFVCSDFDLVTRADMYCLIKDLAKVFSDTFTVSSFSVKSDGDCCDMAYEVSAELHLAE